MCVVLAVAGAASFALGTTVTPLVFMGAALVVAALALLGLEGLSLLREDASK